MAALQALEGALLAFSTHEDGGSAEFGRIAGALAELDGKFAARELVEAGGAAAQHDEGAASAGHGELLRLQRRWQMAKLEKESYTRMIHDARTTLGRSDPGAAAPDGAAQAAATRALVREIQDRRAMDGKLHHRTQEKRALQIRNVELKRQLDKLQTHATTLAARAAPAMQSLEVDSLTLADAEHEPAAAGLPEALFILHRQLLAARRLFPGLQVWVEQILPDTADRCQAAVAMTLETRSRVLRVDFTYDSAINAVLAASHDHAVLDTLFPEDAGDVYPHASCVHAFLGESSDSRAQGLNGKPYRWCQHMAGLEVHLGTVAAEQMPQAPASTFAPAAVQWRCQRQTTAIIGQMLARAETV